MPNLDFHSMQYLMRLREQLQKTLEKRNNAKLGDATVVRIPDIPGRIRKIPKQNNPDDYSVEYISDQWYDEEKGQSRNEKHIIGVVLSEYPMAMLPNDNYEKYFDMRTGRPKNRPAKDRKKTTPEEPAAKAIEEPEQTKEPQIKEPQTKAPIPPTNLHPQPQPQPKEPEPEEQPTTQINEQETKSMEEIPNEEEFLEQFYEEYDSSKKRSRILFYILDNILDSIRTQAKKRPDDVVNEYKVNKINALLREIKQRYQNTGYEDLLELIDPPQTKKENGQTFLTGLTYSDLEVLLDHYYTVLDQIDVG